MRTVDDAHAWAQRQWRSKWAGWLGDGGAVEVSWPLHEPTEREFSADPDGIAREVGRWREFARRDGVRVDWTSKRWPSCGTQQLPHRVTLDAGAVATMAGQSPVWERARAAAGQLREAWPSTDFAAALTASARQLGHMDEGEVLRLLAVLGWLEAHPDSGLWERELPIEGVDTKWMERHRAVVEHLTAAITGAGTGLRRHELRYTVRLDAGASGAREFAAGLTQLAAMEVGADRVLIVENLTTLAVLPELPGTVVVHGMGFAAPSLAEVPWIQGAEQWYWGDLDSHGYAILGQVRRALPGVRSVLMDLETFDAYERLAVEEPRPFRGEIGYLSLSERHGLSRVRAENRRLEQERVPRDYAKRALLREFGAGAAPSQ